MSEQSDKLKKIAGELYKNFQDISSKVELMEKGPLVKSLVGKYLKYKNGYGLSGFWIYKKVVGFKNVELFIDSFQEDKYGKIEFDHNVRAYSGAFMNNSHILIDKKEYNIAFNKILKKLIKRGKSR